MYAKSFEPRTGRQTIHSVSLFLLFATLVCVGSSACGQSVSQNSILNKVGFDQNLDNQVPLDLPFKNNAPKPRSLCEKWTSWPIAPLTEIRFRISRVSANFFEAVLTRDTESTNT